MQEKGLAVTRVKHPSDADNAAENRRQLALQPQLADNSVFEALGNPDAESINKDE